MMSIALCSECSCNLVSSDSTVSFVLSIHDDRFLLKHDTLYFNKTKFADELPN